MNLKNKHILITLDIEHTNVLAILEQLVLEHFHRHIEKKYSQAEKLVYLCLDKADVEECRKSKNLPTRNLPERIEWFILGVISFMEMWGK